MGATGSVQSLTVEDTTQEQQNEENPLAQIPSALWRAFTRLVNGSANSDLSQRQQSIEAKKRLNLQARAKGKAKSSGPLGRPPIRKNMNRNSLSITMTSEIKSENKVKLENGRQPKKRAGRPGKTLINIKWKTTPLKVAKPTQTTAIK